MAICSNKTSLRRGFVFWLIENFQIHDQTFVIPARPEGSPLGGNAGIQGLSSYYFNFNFAGGSPAAGHFLLCGQKKVTKENAALPSRPFGVPCVARATGRLCNSRTFSISG